MDNGKMEMFPAKVRRLWSKWELRVLVVVSLSIQIFLIIFGSQRKRTVNKLINLSLWVGYLSADWAATLALGVLCNSQNDDCDNNSKHQNANTDNDLLAFWAPFLLLHLGGPDSITAFSLEDNQLWLRHLFGLLFQVGVAFYIFIRSLPSTRLWVATVLMFIGGIIKYAERTWALMTACWDNFKKSMATNAFESDPNHAKLKESFEIMTDAGLNPKIVWENDCESQFFKKNNESDSQVHSSQSKSDGDETTTDHVDLVIKAYDFFKIFKRLIADLILTVDDRNNSQSFFMNCTWKEAYEVIEIELGYVYEVLFTKAAVNHSGKGRIFRSITFASILSAFIIFLFTKKQHYFRIDIILTYVLLGGAIALEIWSLVRLLLSNWTILSIHQHPPPSPISKCLSKLASFFRKSIQFIGSTDSQKSNQSRGSTDSQSSWYNFLVSYFPKLTLTQSRWSNSIAQYNLIDYCLNDQSRIFKNFMKLIRLKDIIDAYWYRSYNRDDIDAIKERIFNDLTGRLRDAIDSDSYKQFSTCRGELAVDKYKKELEWSVKDKVDLDESILLWHIATDICYYCDEQEHPKGQEPQDGQEHGKGTGHQRSCFFPCFRKGREHSNGDSDKNVSRILSKKHPKGQEPQDGQEHGKGPEHPCLRFFPCFRKGQEHSNGDSDKNVSRILSKEHPKGQEPQDGQEHGKGPEHPCLRFFPCFRKGQEHSNGDSDKNMSRILSNYMLYLLVSRPFMLAAEIGQIKFGQTCDAAEKFYYGEKAEDSEKQNKRDKTSTRKRLCEFFTKDSSNKEAAEGDKSKGMLFDACRLAKSLLDLKIEQRWEFISQVWLEMIYYAAIHCKAYHHVQRLSAGGELLTIVWFLMAHLGIGEKYRPHARVKLIVDK